MRFILILLSGLICSQPVFAVGDNPLDSNEALRARVKIKFALDPLLSMEKVTLQQQKEGLILVGQVSHPIIAEQALYLIEQSNVEAGRIKNELVINKTALTNAENDALIHKAASARILAATKYQMQDIPLVGVDLAVEDGNVTVKSNVTKAQKANIKEALKGIQQIKSIKFIPARKPGM